MGFIAFESFAVTTVLPVAMTDLDGQNWYSMSYAATITTGLVGYVIAGMWIDAHGVRKPLAIGGALFVLGIAVCALAPSAPMFVLGRLIQGFGGGVDSVVIYVLIARTMTVDMRPRMFALLSAAWLLPSLVGPLAAGHLTELTTWRTVFCVAAGGSAIAIVALLIAGARPSASSSLSSFAGADFPDRSEGPAVKSPHRNVIVALMAAGALVSLHFAGQLSVVEGLVLLLLGSLILLPAARMLLPAGTFTLRTGAPRLVGLRAILGAITTASDVHLTLYLQDQRGFASSTAGLVIASGAAGWAAGSWIQGRFDADRTRDGRLLALAAPLVSFGPVIVVGYTLDLLSLPAVILGCVLMGAGMGIAYPRIASATLRITNSDEHGRYSASLQASESMGTAALLAVIGILLSAMVGDSGFVTSYLVLAVLGLVGIAIVWWPTGSLRDASRT
ncbi:MFS transporter [Brevibacterium sp. RIT 803]|uniref:MFS transporter n=1 Tax=Brevibacterium sp. RIT 803 TaxID=2810210 RepID=UPI00194E2E1D|nr:MFS transporter [Brevibacterium sp. RIT 803]MBM6591534.1 MFS transporter [Brevibacterium sp. RIT 803]